MLRANLSNTWLGLIRDAAGMTVLAVQGVGDRARVLEARQIEHQPEELIKTGRSEALESFVREGNFRGCPVRVAFVGSGTVVQRMLLPPLGARDRRQAVETHLMNFTEGHKLSFDIIFEPKPKSGKGVRLLAGGVDRELSRAVCSACRRASLRVREVTALAGVCGAGAHAGSLVQVILGERTTTIQLLQDQKLIATRDLLFGRRDFIQAYQRPILTDEGPLTLSAEEAERLAREVGIPMGMEHEIRPGVRATQLWPTLNPVLQRLMHEIQQSLVHGGWSRREEVSLSLLGLSCLPGLDEFLVAELQLHDSLHAPDDSERVFLAALSEIDRGGAMDLRPPEERFGQRLTRPALAAGICALLIILGNAHAPRKANARVELLAPAVRQLQDQLRAAREQRANNEDISVQINEQLRRRGALSRILPPEFPVAGPLKVVCETLPSEMELMAVRLENGPKGRMLTARVAYRGRLATSIAATRWAREISESSFFENAEVSSVSGSGLTTPAVAEIRARVRGG